MGSLLEELKRRKVVRVAVAYAVVAWLLIQVVATIEGALKLPDWADTLTIILLAVGFPVAVILAWAYDVTPGGIVRTTPDISPVATESAGAADQPSQQSIAVLPFVNMSSDPEQEYFSDGISEELLNHLVKLKGLHVAGRTSSFSFKGRNEDLRVIGEKLNVAHILEGSVRKAGNRIRITAQLIKAADGYHLWSETFDRDLDDIFAIQDETARAVASALSITLGVGESAERTGGTNSIEAYDAYLAGIAKYRAFGRREAMRGVELLEDAVAHDPNFGDAWAWLAEIYDMAANTFDAEHAVELTRKSEDAASRAVKIAPDSVAAIRSTGLLALRNRDWVGAERHWQKALRVAPGDADVNYEYGRFLVYVGRPGEATPSARAAVDADPLSFLHNLNLAIVHQLNVEPDAALRQYRRTMQLPGNKHFLRALMLVLAMEMKDRALMDECLADMLSTPAGDLSASETITQEMSSLLDDPGAARARLLAYDADPDYDNPLGRLIIAVWAGYFDDPHLALGQFEHLQESRVAAWFTMWRPIQQAMRLLPGFKDVLRNLGFVDYWRESGHWGDFARPVGADDFEIYR